MLCDQSISYVQYVPYHKIISTTYIRYDINLDLHTVHSSIGFLSLSFWDRNFTAESVLKDNAFFARLTDKQSVCVRVGIPPPSHKIK